jgi:copper homeostasis protein (lipoprotein)
MKNKLPFILIAITVMIGCEASKQNAVSNQENKISIRNDSAHNSRNSLDWAGTYTGTLPCADCEGIETEIRLNNDLSYDITTKYSGKSSNIFKSSNHFKWDESGSKIILEKTESPNITADQYQVGENTLTALDRDGNKIKTGNQETYILKKVSFDNIITEKYWKLIELNGKKFTLTGNQKKEPYFILKNENNRVTGFTGCNSFNGSYEISAGNRIRFSKTISTMMACMDVDYENNYLRVFDVADNYSLKGDTLSLNKARMAALAKFIVVYLR